jgi:hypothetical protein
MLHPYTNINIKGELYYSLLTKKRRIVLLSTGTLQSGNKQIIVEMILDVRRIHTSYFLANCAYTNYL